MEEKKLKEVGSSTILNTNLEDTTNTTDIEENIGVKIRKCPSCGANMHYDPEKLSLVCDYCGTQAEVDFSHGSQELPFSKLLSKEATMWTGETRVYKCSNCGASSIMPRKSISTSCPFCGTPNISETDDIPGLRPNAVVPFKISKEEALNNFYAWSKKRLLSSRKYKRNIKAEDVYGNYIPAFTFDTDTNSQYEGRLGEYYYVTVSDGDGKTHQERKIRYFHISGRISKSFDDILIQATSGVKNMEISKLEPFFTNESRDYNEDFILGYTATMYTKDGQQCWSEARKVMENLIRDAILAKYTYDVVDYVNIDMRCFNTTYKYVLLPVYVGHTRYRNKLYNFFINGETGKVFGRTPKSPIRIGIIVLIIVAIAVGLGFLFSYLGGK